MPSGFSMMLSTSAYSRISGEHARSRRRRRAAGAGPPRWSTATAPETIIARMPVAYAPAWALTSAPNAMVMPMLIAV